jgi:hypothetical protein
MEDAMEPRYKARRRISVAVGSVSGGMRTSTSSPPGFSVFDTLEVRELPEFYETQASAEDAAEKLNTEE